MKAHFRVYDRWGKLLSESQNPDLIWDGSYRGQRQALSVYVYKGVVEFDDAETVELQGNVSLLY